MKEYPSIPRATGQSFREISGAYIFDKPDGSNLRVEGSRKHGFTKFGTRARLFDETDTVFGEAIALFHRKLEPQALEMLRRERWENVTIFMEFWGPNSFAGQHEPNDEKTLEVIDIAPYKKGILGPKELVRLIKTYELPAPKFHGITNWTRGFVERVRIGEFPCSFEGVVAKAGEGHHVVRAKAKTQAWIDKVLARYGIEQGNMLVNS